MQAQNTLLLIATTALLAASLGSRSQIISNGSFEGPRGTVDSINTIEPGDWKWRAPAGGVFNGRVFTQTAYPLASDGQQFIYLGDPPSAISQEINIGSDDTYQLSWHDNTGHALNVYSGGAYAVDILRSNEVSVATRNFEAYHSDFRWGYNSLLVSLPAGAYTVRFRSRAPFGSYSPFIDAVSMTRLVENEDVIPRIRVSAVEISWTGRTNATYQIQYTLNLTSNSWIDFGAPATGTGNNSTTDLVVSGEHRFYRIARIDRSTP